MADGKNVVAILASPHPDGITAKMLSECLRQLPQNMVITHCFSLFSLLPQPCKDCGWCKKQIGCVMHDLDPFMNAYEEADVVIFATPVYNLSFPAPLKSLFDRFQRYYNARFSLGHKPPIAKPKQALLLANCGSQDKRGFAIMRQQMEMAFTVLNTTLVSMVCCAGADQPEIFTFPVEEIRHAVKSLQ